MKVVAHESLPSEPVTMAGAARCTMRCLIGEADGAPSFTMRQFEVGPGGHTPHHAHAYEHEVFVLEGSGEVLDGDAPRPLRPGTAVFVPSNHPHQFRNTGTVPLKFLCLIPHPLRDMGGPCAAACGCD